jgi:carbon storage regulator
VLVLGRKPGEYVVINDTIRVQVVKTEEGQLRLAIDAPRHIKIVRGELLDNFTPPRAAKTACPERN